MFYVFVSLVLFVLLNSQYVSHGWDGNSFEVEWFVFFISLQFK